MSLSADSYHYDRYYDHVLDRKKTPGTLGKVYDLIHDISDRRGLKWEWGRIDGDVQDEIIDTWIKIIDEKTDKNKANN